MLGLAAPGVWFSLELPRPSILFFALYASAVALPATVLAIVHLGAARRFDLTFWIAVILLPMLTLGTAICVLLLRARGRQVARMYAADLAGAAVGALLAVPLLHGLPTPCVVAALGLLPILAAILVGSRRHLISLAYAAVLIGSIVWGDPYRLRYARFYIEDRPPLYEEWTATARITVFDRMNSTFLGWGMGTRFRGVSARDHLWLDQDGSAGTPILAHQSGRPYPDYLCVRRRERGLSDRVAGARVHHRRRRRPRHPEGAAGRREGDRGRRAQPVHGGRRLAGLQRALGRPLRPAGRAGVRRRGAQSLQPLAHSVRRDRDLADRHLRRFGGRRLRADREQSLHRRGDPDVLVALERTAACFPSRGGSRGRRGRSRFVSSCSRSRPFARRESRSRAITCSSWPPAARPTCCCSASRSRRSRSAWPRSSPPGRDSRSCGPSWPARATRRSSPARSRTGRRT